MLNQPYAWDARFGCINEMKGDSAAWHLYSPFSTGSCVLTCCTNLSKFFTWTKGDRTNTAEIIRAANEVPLEYINAQTTYYAGNGLTPRKTGKRPPPLTIHDNFTPQANMNSRMSDSLALQDAAVRSATTLMTVMNDVLRSPQLSTHLAASNAYSNESLPVFQRRRARTVPSTPLCEAPTPDTVELPASMPGDFERPLQSASCKKTQESASSLDSPLRSPVADRPGVRSIPLTQDSDSCVESVSSYAGIQEPSAQISSPQKTRSSPPNFNDSTLSGVVGASTPAAKRRPSFVLSPSVPSNCSTAPPLVSRRSRDENEGGNALDNRRLVQAEADCPIDRASELRTLHEAHVRSLKAAHEQETVTYKAYIRLLEQQNLRQRVEHGRSKSDSTINGESKGNSGGAVEPSSIEITLRDTLSSLECRLTAAEDDRIELQNRLKEANDKMRVSTQREKTLNQELHDLRNQTVASNRLAAPYTPPDSGQGSRGRTRQKRTLSDLGTVAETAHPLLQQIRDLRKVVSEKDAHIRQLEQQSITKQSKPQQNTPIVTTIQVPHVSSLMRDLDEQKRLLKSARADIEQYNSLLHAELRRQARGSTEIHHSTSPEIQAHAINIAGERISRLRAKAATNASDGHAVSALQGPSTIALLEKELHYYIYQIVMYKLDVKAYKKELKKAHCRIHALESGELVGGEVAAAELSTTLANNMELAASPRSPRETPPQIGSRSGSTTHQRNDSVTAEESIASALTIKAGLGVSLLEVVKKSENRHNSSNSTPRADKTPYSISTSATPPSLPPRPSASMSTYKSPITSPRTPLRIDKELPEPPSSASPVREKNPRLETVRSLSDSAVVSSSLMGQEKLQRWKPGPLIGRVPVSEPLPAVEFGRVGMGGCSPAVAASVGM